MDEEITLNFPQGPMTPYDDGVVAEDTPGARITLDGGGQSTLPPNFGIATDSSVVSSEPAEDAIEADRTFIGEYAEPVDIPDEPLFDDETDLTPEEVAFVEGEEKDPQQIELDRLQAEKDAETQAIYDELTDLQRKSDSITADQIEMIRAKYKQLEKESREISRRRTGGLQVMGFRTGRTRYAPEIQSGIIAGEQRALVKQISELGVMEAMAINEARQAQMERDFSLAHTKIEFVKELRKEKSDRIEDLRAKIEEKKENEQKLARQAQVIDYMSKGETDPLAIFRKLGGAVSLDEVVEVTSVIQADVDRMNLAVTSAIQSGLASNQEMESMRNKSLSLEQREDIANGVIGRMSKAEWDLNRSVQWANIEAKKAQTRLSLIEAAKKGDKQAQGLLGGDWTDMEEAERLVSNGEAVVDIQEWLKEIATLKTNKVGIETTSGAVNKAFGARAMSFLIGAGIDEDASFGERMAKSWYGTPILGNINQMNETMDARNKFLTDVSYLISNETFKKLADITENTTLGQISEGELALVQSAATQLGQAARYKDGKLTHFEIGEEDLVAYLEEIETNYQKAIDKYNREVLNAEERLQINDR